MYKQCLYSLPLDSVTLKFVHSYSDEGVSTAANAEDAFRRCVLFEDGCFVGRLGFVNTPVVRNGARGTCCVENASHLASEVCDGKGRRRGVG
jgi:hypothetical protein